MKILLITNYFPPELRSASHLFYELARKLTANGHRVTVVTGFPRHRLGPSDIASQYSRLRAVVRESIDGIDVIRVRTFRFPENLLIARGIDHLLIPLAYLIGCWLSGNQDIALVYSPPLTLGLTAYALYGCCSVPFVFNVQDIYPQTLVELGLMKNPVLIQFFERIENFVYAKAARIVVHSEGNREYLITRKPVRPEKVAVIPNWIDTDIIQPSNPSNGFRRKHDLESRFIVSYAGTMGYAQDLSPVIEAARKLQLHKDILFLLIGEGVLEAEWKLRVNAYGLENVRFLPLQPESLYPSIVAAADIGLVPLTEQLTTPVIPGKLLDYMAGGRPVIATVNPDGDTSKIIQETHCGYALTPGDGQGLAETILSLYRDRSLARQLGSNGRAYAEKHLSLEVCTAYYEELFEQIICEQSSGL